MPASHNDGDSNHYLEIRIEKLFANSLGTQKAGVSVFLHVCRVQGQGRKRQLREGPMAELHPRQERKHGGAKDKRCKLV